MHTRSLAEQTFGMCTKSTGVCNDKDSAWKENSGVPWTINPMFPSFHVPRLPNTTNVHILDFSCVLNKHPSWNVYLFIYLIKNATLYGIILVQTG